MCATHRFHSVPARKPGQGGIVLVVALIFLTLLSVFTLATAGRSLLQERMAGNLRDAELASMSAETALRGVEWMLWRYASQPGNPPLACGSGVLAGHCYRYDPADAALYGPAGLVTVFRTSRGWTEAGAAVYRGPGGGTDYTAPVTDDESASLARNPVYLIEDLGAEWPPDAAEPHEAGDSGRRIYRITVRATGSRADTIRVMKSTFVASGGSDEGAAAAGTELWRRRSWRELEHD